MASSASWQPFVSCTARSLYFIASLINNHFSKTADVTGLNHFNYKILLARPGGLWSKNCLKEEHVLWEKIFFWSTCLSG